MNVELSIIIPVLNEAGILPELVRNLAEQKDVVAEIIICDGGSSDGTVELARQLAGETAIPVRTLSSPPGRAIQMNEGAHAAAGETLLFLHADSRF